MNGRRILLLGGGFIGSALMKRLAQTGNRVHLISRRPLDYAAAGITAHVSSLDNSDLLHRLLPECSAVVHLASDTTPGSSATRPELEIGNLAPTLRFLQVLRDYPHVQLVFLSSGGTVYGNPSYNPVNEDAPLAPLSWHGAGKLAQESLLHPLRSAGHAVTVLRPSNTYGPGQSLRSSFGLVRTVLQHALEETTLQVWGDGENVRDFVFIDDVVESIRLALSNPASDGIFNVGSGRGHTVKQVIAMAEQICGRKIIVNYRAARCTDVRKVVLDVSRIRAVHGWQPRIGLEEGMHRTWEWVRH